MHTLLRNITFYLPPITMIDTDTFIEQMLIKAMPEIDDEGLDMMIEDTKPVLYDRVMTHIVGQIDTLDHKKNEWNEVFLDARGIPTTWEVASTNEVKWLQSSKAVVYEKDGQWFLDILEEKGVTPEAADYLKAKIPNFPDFLEKVYDDFETMYLKEFKNFEKEFGDEIIEDEEK